MDDRDDLLIRYLRQFSLPPLPPRQNVFKTHAVANQPTYSPPGRSHRPASVPPIPGLALVIMRRTKAQSRRFIYVEVFCLAPPRRTSITWWRRPPLPWTMRKTTTPPVQVSPQGGRRRRCPPSEHGWVRPGTKESVAEAVASPLGVQPNINSAEVSSSTGQPLGLMQL